MVGLESVLDFAGGCVGSPAGPSFIVPRRAVIGDGDDFRVISRTVTCSPARAQRADENRRQTPAQAQKGDAGS